MNATERDPEAEKHVEKATRLIRATPEQIFDLLTDTHRHAALDGSGMLRGEPQGPDRLVLGSRFTMGMKQRGASYRSINTVVEYAEDELIAWATSGEFRGRPVVGGQRWRYELEPHRGQTLVHHSYVWGYAALRRMTIQLPGFPAKMRVAIVHTLANLERAVISG